MCLDRALLGFNKDRQHLQISECDFVPGAGLFPGAGYPDILAARCGIVKSSSC